MRTLTTLVGGRAVRNAVALAVLLVTLGCGRDAAPRKRQLVKLPQSYARESLVVAEDAETWAYVDMSGSGQRVVTPAGAGEPYRECSRPLLSPRRGRVIYWAREGPISEGGMTLVADGRRAGSGFARQGKAVFSADGARWAAVAGTPSHGEGDDLERGEVVLLADGKEIDRQPDASHPTLSPDGRQVAYLAETEPGRITLIVDGERRRTAEQPGTPCATALKSQRVGPNLHPQFVVHYLSDGSLLSLTQDREGWGVYRDDTRLASYPMNLGDPRIASVLSFGDECSRAAAIVSSTFALATKAPVAAWWERVADTEGRRWRVVLNGRPADDFQCASYWDDPTPHLSEDGAHVAYPCTSIDPTRPGQVDIVKDGQRFGPYHDAWGMAFSPDGRRLVYDARSLEQRPTWSAYVDGRQLPGKYQLIWRPRFDPTGERIAWEGQETLEQRRRGMLILDGRPVGSFDEVLRGPEFPPGRVSWVFRRGRRVMRLDLPLR